MQSVNGSNWPAHKFPAAIGALVIQPRSGTVGAEGAFKRTNHRLFRIRREISITTLATWFYEQHRVSLALGQGVV
jgi:hypothetical protein